MRATKRVLIGSLAAASDRASFAVCTVTPSISKITRPGFTRATHNSGVPLPEPMRTSAGFLDTGTSGKMRIQTRPARFMCRVSARRALTRHMKRAGRVWIRIFPDVPVSKKPAEVRMGSGKGTPELWVARVKPGRVIFEIDGVTVQTAKEALSLAAAKLPIKTRFVARIAE